MILRPEHLRKSYNTDIIHRKSIDNAKYKNYQQQRWKLLKQGKTSKTSEFLKDYYSKTYFNEHIGKRVWTARLSIDEVTPRERLQITEYLANTTHLSEISSEGMYINHSENIIYIPYHLYPNTTNLSTNYANGKIMIWALIVTTLCDSYPSSACFITKTKNAVFHCMESYDKLQILFAGSSNYNKVVRMFMEGVRRGIRSRYVKKSFCTTSKRRSNLQGDLYICNIRMLQCVHTIIRSASDFADKLQLMNLVNSKNDKDLDFVSVYLFEKYHQQLPFQSNQLLWHFMNGLKVGRLALQR